MKKILILFPVIMIILGIYIVLIKNNQVKKQIIVSSPSNTKNLSPISIDYLRSLNIDSEKIKIEETLEEGSNYKRYIVSYLSEGNKIYGLLIIPDNDELKGGFSAVIFNHGYIPPNQYQTTENYVAYVDYLARNGFVVFKIDFRGNGKLEGDASG
jgi:hypothetical protein